MRRVGFTQNYLPVFDENGRLAGFGAVPVEIMAPTGFDNQVIPIGQEGGRLKVTR